MAGGVIQGAWIQGISTLISAGLVVVAAKIQANAMKQQVVMNAALEQKKFREEATVFALLALNDARVFIEHAKERQRSITYVRDYLGFHKKLPPIVNNEYTQKNLLCDTWWVKREQYRYVYAMRNHIQEAIAKGGLLRDEINNNIKEMLRWSLGEDFDKALSHAYLAEQAYIPYINVMQDAADSIQRAFQPRTPSN